MTKNSISLAVLLLAASFGLGSESEADTLHFKNGKIIEGKIRLEDAEKVEIELAAGGMARFKKTDIDHIEGSRYERSEAEEIEILKRQINAPKIQPVVSIPPPAASFSSGEMYVNVLLNGKLTEKMLLDTGASFVFLSQKTAKKLGYPIRKSRVNLRIELADGRIVSAIRIRLRSVTVDGQTVKNLDGAVLLNEKGEDSMNVLGMSFLRKFTYSINHEKKTLSLKKKT